MLISGGWVLLYQSTHCLNTHRGKYFLQNVDTHDDVITHNINIKTCYPYYLSVCGLACVSNRRKWVNNYPHCTYIFWDWLHCCLGKYKWSPPLLTLWCKFALNSDFLSSVSCRKHRSSAFRLNRRTAAKSDPLLLAEGVPSAKMHRRMSVQYENSAVSQQCQQTVHAWPASQPKIFIPSSYRRMCNDGPSALKSKGTMLKDDARSLHL